MPSETVSLPGLLSPETFPSQYVLPNRHGLHMGRVTATPVSTEMVDSQARGDWPYLEFICQPVDPY